MCYDLIGVSASAAGRGRATRIRVGGIDRDLRPGTRPGREPLSLSAAFAGCFRLGSTLARGQQRRSQAWGVGCQLELELNSCRRSRRDRPVSSSPCGPGHLSMH
eukprot:1573745-Rhodomonas_salina.1